MKHTLKLPLLTIALLLSTPVWAETIQLFHGGEEKTYEIREKLICDPINEVRVKMNDFEIDTSKADNNYLKTSPALILNFLKNGDLVIEYDYFVRLEGSEDSLEGFFHWGSLIQVEIKSTDTQGVLMIQNKRNASWASGRYEIWTTHHWFRCYQ